MRTALVRGGKRVPLFVKPDNPTTLNPSTELYPDLVDILPADRIPGEKQCRSAVISTRRLNFIALFFISANITQRWVILAISPGIESWRRSDCWLLLRHMRFIMMRVPTDRIPGNRTRTSRNNAFNSVSAVEGLRIQRRILDESAASLRPLPGSAR